MFPRRARLARTHFPTAHTRTGRLSSPHFMVSIPEDVRGYAVVVPKKAVRLSVARHTVKRRVLEALRTLPLPPALIVYPRASAAALSYAETRAELAALLSKFEK